MATFARVSLCAVLSVSLFAGAQEKKLPSYYGPQPETEAVDLTMYQRIRTEGMQHGKVMQFAQALNDGIGPRLTGSPNMAGQCLDARHAEVRGPRKRAPRRLGRVRHGLAADQHLGADGGA